MSEQIAEKTGDAPPERVSPWLRLYSIGLSLTLATLGTVLVFALFLHGSFLDRFTSWATEGLADRPVLQSMLALSPLIAALMLGWAATQKRRRRQKAEEMMAARKAAGLD